MGGAPAVLPESFTMQSTIQIFKLDEVKKGISKKNGNPYEIHTAQAALIDVAGNIDTVGVLDIPPQLRDQVKPGIYAGSFAMKTNFSTGRIEAVLVGLTPAQHDSLACGACACLARDWGRCLSRHVYLAYLAQGSLPRCQQRTASRLKALT